MGLCSEIARLPNDHLQLEGADTMCRSTRTRRSSAPYDCAARDAELQSRSRSTRKRKPPRRGTSAVELALVAPVFFLLVFGLIELGRMVMVQQALTNAAREGCRTAVLATTINSSDVEASIRNYLNSVISNAWSVDEVRTTVPAGLGSTTTGTELTVAVEVDYADVSWLPMGSLGHTHTIAARQIGKRE